MVSQGRFSDIFADGDNFVGDVLYVDECVLAQLLLVNDTMQELWLMVIFSPAMSPQARFESLSFLTFHHRIAIRCHADQFIHGHVKLLHGLEHCLPHKFAHFSFQFDKIQHRFISAEVFFDYADKLEKLWPIGNVCAFVDSKRNKTCTDNLFA